MINETNRIQKYIDVHKNLVLHDALKDLENCELNELPRLLHRLKGTLGTFQFQVLSETLRTLLFLVRQEKNLSNLQKAKEDAMNAIQSELQKEEN